jgi:hypothetical protein
MGQALSDAHLTQGILVRNYGGSKNSSYDLAAYVSANIQNPSR